VTDLHALALPDKTEVQVPTLHLKPLDELFHESNMEMQNTREKGTNVQPNSTYSECKFIAKYLTSMLILKVMKTRL